MTWLAFWEISQKNNNNGYPRAGSARLGEHGEPPFFSFWDAGDFPIHGQASLYFISRGLSLLLVHAQKLGGGWEEDRSGDGERRGYMMMGWPGVFQRACSVLPSLLLRARWRYSEGFMLCFCLSLSVLTDGALWM